MDEELRRLQEEVDLLRKQHFQIQQRLDSLDGQIAALAGRRAAAPGPAPQHAEAKKKPAKSAPGSSNLESKIGGIWLNRVGVVAFIIGAAFFLKLAFDQGWINELTRIAVGTAAGLLMLWLGEKTRRRGYSGYGQGLTGGGIALLYFTVYAAFYFYEILHPLAAAALMVLVTLSAVALSVLQSAPAIAVLGLLTGFLTPFLFLPPQPQLLPILIYFLLLNLGIVAVSSFKRWAFMGTTAFILTNLTMIWMLINRLHRPDLDLGPVSYQLFLSLFFLLFIALPLLLYYTRRRPLGALGVFLLVAGTASYYALSWFNLQPVYPDQMGLFTAALAGFFLLAGVGARRLPFRDPGLSFTAFSLTAALLVLFIPVQLKQAWITAGWALQAAVLCFLGLRLADRRIRFGFWMVILLATARLLAVEWPLYINPEEYRFLINRAAVLTFLLIAILVFCAWLYHRFRPAEKGWFNEVNILGAAAGLLFLVFCSVDIGRYGDVLASRTGEWTDYHNLSMLAISIFWGCYAAVFMAAGFIRKQPLPRYAAIALFGITVVKVFLFDLSFLDLVYRIISLVALGLILLAVSYLYQSNRSRIEPPQ